MKYDKDYVVNFAVSGTDVVINTNYIKIFDCIKSQIKELIISNRATVFSTDKNKYFDELNDNVIYFSDNEGKYYIIEKELAEVGTAKHHCFVYDPFSKIKTYSYINLTTTKISDKDVKNLYGSHTIVLTKFDTPATDYNEDHAIYGFMPTYLGKIKKNHYVYDGNIELITMRDEYGYLYSYTPYTDGLFYLPKKITEPLTHIYTKLPQIHLILEDYIKENFKFNDFNFNFNYNNINEYINDDNIYNLSYHSDLGMYILGMEDYGFELIKRNELAEFPNSIIITYF